MDVAYKQHANQARRKNRSSTNLNHLTLAPLTSKLPLHDAEDFADAVAAPLQHNISYLQGKSAPPTPRLLSRSPPRTASRSRRSSVHAPAPNTLPKSKSASHLAGLGPMSPVSRRRKDDHGHVNPDDRNDSDWMLRAGALISSETRESKGQAWLVSRASTTSLTGMRDTDEEAFERELAREKELASRRGSRRGSFAGADDSFTATGSRLGSRSHSRAGSKAMVRTPIDRHVEEGYFDQHYTASPDEYIEGPDFVSLDEKLEAIEIDTSQADEATIRKLVKRESTGTGSWMGNIIGFSLFSVDEHDEDSDNADGEVSDGEGDEGQLERSPSTRHFEDISTAPVEPRIPPPKADEGGWQDAAWLLSVASKVLL